MSDGEFKYALTLNDEHGANLRTDIGQWEAILASDRFKGQGSIEINRTGIEETLKTERKALLRIEELELGIRQCCEIIELADTRALAVDGSVSHVRDTMTDKEWRRLYKTLKRLAQPT